MSFTFDLPEQYKIKPPAKYKPIDFKKEFHHFFDAKSNPQQVFNDIQEQSFYLEFALPIFRLYPPILGLEKEGFPKKLASKLEDMSHLGDIYGVDNFTIAVQYNIPNINWEKYKDKILDSYYDRGALLQRDGYSTLSMVHSFCVHYNKEELAKMYSPNPLQPLLDEFFRKESFFLNVFINKLENDAFYKEQIKEFGTLKFYPEFMDTNEVIAWYKDLATYIKRYFPSEYRDSFCKLDDEMKALENTIKKVSQKLGYSGTVGRNRKVKVADKKLLKLEYLELVSKYNDFLQREYSKLVYIKAIAKNNTTALRKSVDKATLIHIITSFCAAHADYLQYEPINVNRILRLDPSKINTSNKLIMWFLSNKYETTPSYLKQLLKSANQK